MTPKEAIEALTAWLPECSEESAALDYLKERIEFLEEVHEIYFHTSRYYMNTARIGKIANPERHIQAGEEVKVLIEKQYPEQAIQLEQKASPQ